MVTWTVPLPDTTRTRTTVLQTLKFVGTDRVSSQTEGKKPGPKVAEKRGIVDFHIKLYGTSWPQWNARFILLSVIIYILPEYLSSSLARYFIFMVGFCDFFVFFVICICLVIAIHKIFVMIGLLPAIVKSGHSLLLPVYFTVPPFSTFIMRFAIKDHMKSNWLF